MRDSIYYLSILYFWYDAYNGGAIQAVGIRLSGTGDYPLIFKETGNDDVKGLQVYDNNDTLRYILRFNYGKLTFISYNSSGVEITNKDLA